MDRFSDSNKIDPLDEIPDNLRYAQNTDSLCNCGHPQSIHASAKHVYRCSEKNCR